MWNTQLHRKLSSHDPSGQWVESRPGPGIQMDAEAGQALLLVQQTVLSIPKAEVYNLSDTL